MYRLICPGCFAVFGLLVGLHPPVMPKMIVLGLAGGLYGWMAAAVLAALGAGCCRPVGYRQAAVAVDKAMLLLVPFMLLALCAELVLKWNAAQAFATAGLMTGAGAAGLETARLGGRPLVCAIAASGGAAALAIVWILAVPLAIKLI